MVTDRHLRERGYQPTDMLRWMVELVLYPACRDVHIDAEKGFKRPSQADRFSAPERIRAIL
jgi:hypothetical protein